MSWIKNTMGRLFGSSEENSFDEKPDSTQNNEVPQESDLAKRRAFKFPMITDAEIYGWEDDSDDSHTSPNVYPLINEELPFEKAPPLFENERWPKEMSIGKIHRAGNRKKYEQSLGQEKQEEPKSTSPERKKEIIEKRVNSPFKPTEIPSPVYGFKKPRKVGSTEQQSQNDDTLRSDEYEVEKEYQVDSDDFWDVDNSPISEVSSDNTLEQKSKTIENLPNRESIQESLQRSIFRNDEDRTQISNGEKNDRILYSDNIESSTQVKKDIIVDSTCEPFSEQEIPLEVAIQDISSVTNDTHSPVEEVVTDDKELQGVQTAESVAISSESNQRNDSFAIEENDGIEEPKREKTMPFNVVMLKSDKEKMQSTLTDFERTTYDDLSHTKGNLQQSDNSFTSGDTKEIKVKEKAERSEVSNVTYGKTELAEQSDKVVSPANYAAELPMTEREDALQHYVFPTLADLQPAVLQQEDTEWLSMQSEKLVEALSHFSVQAEILEAVQGPTVTRFELTVGFGTKVSKVRNLTDDLKLALAAEDIRIQAPIPGTSSIGIEIPNRTTRPVRISEVIGSDNFRQSTSPLEAVLGLNLTGEPITLDLRKMPHGMIAGATGSGKSVCINSILISLLFKASPAELKLMLIDPKMVELAPFNGVPHLISPVITDVKAATAALKWAVDEMERRYELFAHAGARNIERYNKMAEDNRQFSLKMPYLLIVIDELADLMMVAPSEVEVSISRIAQKARACGIHLIIATQRPSVDVITGLIKANIPTRIAFAVSSQVDSRTILDIAGAERLLGRGDMLYIGNGQSVPIRLQGTFVTDEEIEKIIDHVKGEAEPDYLFGQEDLLAAVVEEEETDPLFTQACSFIIEQGSASTSLLQRHFSIGYNRAAKLMDRMEAHGFISEQRGSRPRDVYVTQADLDAFLNPTNEA